MVRNSYIDLDYSPTRFSSLANLIARLVEENDEDLTDEVTLNFFTGPLVSNMAQSDTETRRNYERRLRSAYREYFDCLLASVRIIVCVEVRETRPTDLFLLSGLLSLISEIFSCEVHCEIYTLKYARDHVSPFATGFEIVSVESAKSPETYSEKIGYIAEMLEANDQIIDAAAVRREFPRVDKA